MRKILSLLVVCFFSLALNAQPDPPPPPGCWRFANITFPAHDTSVCLNSSAMHLHVDTTGGAFSGPHVSGNLFTPTEVGTFKVMYTHPDTCIRPDSVYITVTAILTSPTVITGPDTVCDSEIASFFSTQTIANAQVYHWTVSPSGAGNFIQNTNSLMIDWASYCGPVTITSWASNGCGNTPATTLQVERLCLTPILTSNDTYCVTADTFHLTTSVPGGVWSGNCVSAEGVLSPATVGACAVTYTVSLAGCVGQFSQNIVVNPATTIGFSVPLVACADTLAALSASPAGGVWSPPLSTLLHQGENTFTYTLTAPYGCSAQGSVTLDAIARPVAGFGYEQINCKTVCFGDMSENSTSWYWDFGDGLTGNDACHTFSDTGTYCVTQYAINSCGIDDTTICIFVGCTGLNPAMHANEIALYPNPSNGLVYIDFPAGPKQDYTLLITDVAGAQVYKQLFKNASGSINNVLNLTGFAPGIYLVNIAGNNGFTTFKKLIIH